MSFKGVHRSVMVHIYIISLQFLHISSFRMNLIACQAYIDKIVLIHRNEVIILVFGVIN